MNLAPTNEGTAKRLPYAIAELEQRLCEIEWRLEQRRMPEAIRRINDLGAAIDLHLRSDLSVVTGVAAPQGTAVTPEWLLSDERALARSLLWRAHEGFRESADGALETISALADLRELLVDHARCFHGH